jgi:hypothetical protein
MMEAFYTGLHQPSDAQHFDRCCIHVQRLSTRQKPLGCADLLLDSQAFRVLEIHGDHQLTPLAYAVLAAQIATLCPRVTVVTQDYMCEQYIFDCRQRLTGMRFTVADHQRLTIARYDALHYHAARSHSPVWVAADAGHVGRCRVGVQAQRRSIGYP